MGHSSKKRSHHGRSADHGSHGVKHEREIVPDAAAELEAARFFAWARRERIFIQIILYTVSYTHLTLPTICSV